MQNRVAELLSIANRIAEEQGFDMEDLVANKEASKISKIWTLANKEFDNKYKISKE